MHRCIYCGATSEIGPPPPEAGGAGFTRPEGAGAGPYAGQVLAWKADPVAGVPPARRSSLTPGVIGLIVVLVVLHGLCCCGSFVQGWTEGARGEGMLE